MKLTDVKIRVTLEQVDELAKLVKQEFERLNGRITYMERRLRQMSEQEQELDAGLTALKAELDNTKTAVDALVAAQQAGKTDLSDEIQAVADALGATTAIHDEVVGATPTPPA